MPNDGTSATATGPSGDDTTLPGCGDLHSGIEVPADTDQGSASTTGTSTSDFSTTSSDSDASTSVSESMGSHTSSGVSEDSSASTSSHESATETATDTSSASDETTEEATEEDHDVPALGATPNPECKLARERFGELVAALQAEQVDAKKIDELYRGIRGAAGLVRFVRTYGAYLERVDHGVLIDDAAIEALLIDASSPALRKIQATIETLTVRVIRRRIREAIDLLLEPTSVPALRVQRSDDAYCYLHATLQHWSVPPADSIGDPDGYPEIVASFAAMHQALLGQAPTWSMDEYELRAARHTIDKSLDRLAIGHFLGALRLAKVRGSAVDLERAAAYFEILRDRLRRLNTPGIARIEAALAADPKLVDLAQLERDVYVAFAKHLRRRTPEVIESLLVGDPLGYEQVAQAKAFGDIVFKDLASRVTGFDAEAWQQAWAGYLLAAREGDAEQAARYSEFLVATACAYQAALGLSTCVATGDETK